jgi:hypothetical protein
MAPHSESATLEAVDPTFYREKISTQIGDQKLSPPSVIAEGDHRGRLQFMAVLAVQGLAGNLVVTVAEDIGFDDHGFTDNAFDGESSAINLGRNSRNDDSLSAIRRSQHRRLSFPLSRHGILCHYVWPHGSTIRRFMPVRCNSRE